MVHENASHSSGEEVNAVIYLLLTTHFSKEIMTESVNTQHALLNLHTDKHRSVMQSDGLHPYNTIEVEILIATTSS